MEKQLLRLVLFCFTFASAPLSQAQPDPGPGLGLRSEITGSAPAGGLVLTHTVWNAGLETATTCG